MTEWIVSVKGRPCHWPAGSSLRAESNPPPEIFSLPVRYVRTGHSARCAHRPFEPGGEFRRGRLKADVQKRSSTYTDKLRLGAGRTPAHVCEAANDVAGIDGPAALGIVQGERDVEGGAAVEDGDVGRVCADELAGRVEDL